MDDGVIVGAGVDGCAVTVGLVHAVAASSDHSRHAAVMRMAGC
jgi:hypothetical protein